MKTKKHWMLLNLWMRLSKGFNLNCNILIVIFLAARIFSIDEPKSPNLPLDPDETSSDRDVRGEKNSKEDMVYSLSVRLCDGREIIGKWQSHANEFSFTHIKNRVMYAKSLKVKNIASINIVSWKLVKLKEKTDGAPYQLIPESIKIITRDGDEYLKNSLKGSEFLELSIENKNGSAKLFSYWLDFLSKDSKWHSGLPHTEGDIRMDCHPDVIRQITFN